MITDLESIIIYGRGHWSCKSMDEWMIWGWGIKGGSLQETLKNGADSLAFFKEISPYLPQGYEKLIEYPVHSGEHPDIQIPLTTCIEPQSAYKILQEYFSSGKHETESYD
jgi:hypothetical protein